MKYYTVYSCVWYFFAEPDTFLCPKTIVEYSEKEPALQFRRHLHARLIIIEAWFRGY